MSRIPDFTMWPSSRAIPHFPRLAWTAPEGIAIKSAYRAEDTSGLAEMAAIRASRPIMRGPYPTMYVTQPWTIRQYAGFSTAEDSNAFYRRNLAQGQMGLSIAFDLPTHRGYDSDHPRVAGDVGMAGVAIDFDLRHAHAVRRHSARQDERVDDHERRGAADHGALYRRGRGAGRSAGETLGHDPERHPQGIHGAEHLYLSAAGIRCASSPTSSPIPARRCRNSIRSRSRAITCRRRERPPISNSPIRSPTGSNMCAPGIAAGLDIDRFAPRLSFFWAIGMNFFMEVAKMRAARMLWAKLMKPVRAERTSARSFCAPIARPRAGASPPRMCSTMWCAPRSRRWRRRRAARNRCTPIRSTRRLALPTDFSARIARNTQLFLQQEAGTCRVIDPWGGSYFVERLTADLAARA